MLRWYVVGAQRRLARPQETCDIDGVTAHSPHKLLYKCGSLKLSFLYFYHLRGRLLRNQARRFTTIRKMPPTFTWSCGVATTSTWASMTTRAARYFFDDTHACNILFSCVAPDRPLSSTLFSCTWRSSWQFCIALYSACARTQTHTRTNTRTCSRPRQ